MLWVTFVTFCVFISNGLSVIMRECKSILISQLFVVTCGFFWHIAFISLKTLRFKHPFLWVVNKFVFHSIRTNSRAINIGRLYYSSVE